MGNYGNSFGPKDYPSVSVSTINVWQQIRHRIPVGLVLFASTTYPEGTVIKAGTPASGTEIGGAATIGSSANLALQYSGLVEKDTVMGSQCCTLSVVDDGDLMIDRISATISDAQKAALKKINFYTQYSE